MMSHRLALGWPSAMMLQRVAVSSRCVRMSRALAMSVVIIGCAQPSEDRADTTPSGANMQSTPPAPIEQPLVTTDRASYRVRRTGDAIELDIVATFTNRTADTVYLHPCGRSQPSFFLERWIDGAWKAAFSPPCPALLMLDPPRVAPGASRTDTARVRASTAPNSFPRFELDPVGGDYRLVYAQAYASWQASGGPGDMLPLERRVSAPFRIEE